MKNVLWAVTVALCLTATGAWAGGEDETEAAAAEPREMVEDPTTGNMLLAPRYGGSISYAAIGSPPSSDVWFTHHSYNAINGVNENLAIGDWAIDRDVFAFDTDVVPVSAMTGQLAESWTMPDDVTVVFTIRDNVFWRDKPPVNGRQLTAHDIAYNWNRYLGFEQFAEQGPSPSLGVAIAGIYESIIATDDRTVVFKLAKPRLDPLYDIVFQLSRSIYAPEVIEQYGDVQDWRNNVGTGPFDLVEWVEESVMVWNRVDDYWGFDEKFPDNRLPYIDEVRAIFMKEPAARIAAIRTRQVDHLGSPGNTQINSIDDANALRKSNPELLFFRRVFRCETCIGFNINNKPFDDINVRRAMQMAFDLEAMNNDFFDGQADWEPEGLIGRGSKAGYFTPMSEWPQEIAQYYRYDSERAGQLLDEAGYPRGDDGIRFRTHYDVWEGRPLPFFDLQVAYWRDIGVEVELRPHDGATLVPLIQSGSYEGMSGRESGFFTGDPLGLLRNLSYTDATWNAPGIDDPKLNAMLDAAAATTDLEEHRRLVKEADLYITANHWYMWSHRLPQIFVFQPWIVGHSGELALGTMERGPVMMARLWIDQELKDEYVK